MANRHLDVGAVLARQLTYANEATATPAFMASSDHSCFGGHYWQQNLNQPNLAL